MKAETRRFLDDALTIMVWVTLFILVAHRPADDEPVKRVTDDPIIRLASVDNSPDV